MWEDAWDGWCGVNKHLGSAAFNGAATTRSVDLTSPRHDAIFTCAGRTMPRGQAVIFHGSRTVRERINDLLEWLNVHHPNVQPMVLTPLGLIPASLEDLNPFAHLDAPPWVLRHEPEAAWIERELQRLGMNGVPFATVDVAGDGLKQRLAASLTTLVAQRRSRTVDPRSGMQPGTNCAPSKGRQTDGPAQRWP